HPTSPPCSPGRTVSTPSIAEVFQNQMVFFFFNDRPPTEIYTLSLHAPLPISLIENVPGAVARGPVPADWVDAIRRSEERSEEHTSELQSLTNLVCRLLLE